jgi:glycosyltransferase involved in cell wall biosynthesis
MCPRIIGALMPSVLLVSIDYWPEETGIGPYSTGLAEHLAAAGHDVTVLAGMPHYPQWQVAPDYRGKWRHREERNGVHIIRRRHYVPTRQSAVRRAAYEASWLFHAGLVAPARRTDAVLGVIPSLSGGIIGRLAAARARAAYGVVVQDLVSAAAAQSGIEGGRTVADMTRRIESWSLSNATVVAPVAEAFRPALSEMGIADERIVILPNWSHLPASSGDRRQTRQRLGWTEDDWIVLHAGNMGLKQGLDQVLDAGRLADRDGAAVRIVLMGDGSQREALVGRAEGTERLEFRAFVATAELPDVLAAADVLLLSERPTVMDMSLPSKLTSYFAAGRPIVAAVHPEGASARELERAGAGVTAKAGDPEALLGAIMGLRDLPDRGNALGQAGRRYAQTALGEAATFARADAIIDRLVERTAVRRRNDKNG